MNGYVPYVNRKLQVLLFQEREDFIPLEQCWTKPPAYLAGTLRGYENSVRSSFIAKRFSLSVKHEGEAVGHEKALAGGLDPAVAHSYQMRFL